MAISKEDVQKISHLARLQIADEDMSMYAKDMSNILELAGRMNNVNTDDISPMAHPLRAKQRLRSDAITETDQHELFQSIAPKVKADLYLVPKVIEE